MEMITGKAITERIKESILLLEHGKDTAQMILNFNFFLVWNHENNDYCTIKISLTPCKSIYDAGKDFESAFNTFISNFMKTKVVHDTYTTIFFHLHYVYSLNMELFRIIKKDIISEESLCTKRETNKFIDQKILSLIQDAGTQGLTISQITNKTQTITKDERAAILQDLIDNEVIFTRTDNSSGRTKIIYLYDNE